MSAPNQRTVERRVVAGILLLLCLAMTGTAVYASLSGSTSERAAAVMPLHSLDSQIATPTLCLPRWVVVNNPDLGIDNYLHSVTAVGPNDLWTVGFAGINGIAQTVTEHWNGSSWGIVSSPNPHDSNLWGVAAVGPNDVWAVGQFWPQNTSQTLTEHWNGTAWSVVASPNPGCGAYLNAVAAAGPNDVWAVGYYALNGTAQREH